MKVVESVKGGVAKEKKEGCKSCMGKKGLGSAGMRNERY